MHHSSLFTYLVLPFICLSPTLAAPASSDAAIAVLSGPFPTDYNTTTSQHPITGEDDETIHTFSDCYGGGDINTGDIEALANDLQNRGGDMYAPALSWFSWTLGSAKACVYNNYVFDNTHVSNWETGWGVRSVREQCCFTPYCGGGTYLHSVLQCSGVN